MNPYHNEASSFNTCMYLGRKERGFHVNNLHKIKKTIVSMSQWCYIHLLVNQSEGEKNFPNPLSRHINKI